eukprot:6371799-Pyramimonas_sp.AAC.1
MALQPHGRRLQSFVRTHASSTVSFLWVVTLERDQTRDSASSSALMYIFSAFPALLEGCVSYLWPPRPESGIARTP